ncbi:MAG: hypothetical protein HBSAPP04_22960 [Ignavibacteriaceae bacterium]|nr:MAG: hypothetical protein HBSAPP04_22960 [Ignavibacteriaceae bacterium]
MHSMKKIFNYQLRDAFRSKLVIFYFIFFLAFTSLMFHFSGEATGVITNLLNINVSFIPLLTLLYGTTFYYNSKGYILFMLTQPVKRTDLFIGIWAGVAIPLVISEIAGILIPFILFSDLQAAILIPLISLLVTGSFIVLVFLALAFFIAVWQDDKAKGFGISISVWLMMALLYDGLILGVSVFFAEYPLEMPLLVISSLNPIDLARIFCLIHLDASALMGYTGAVFQSYFQSVLGSAISLTALFIWTALPLSLSILRFKKKDL